MDFCGKPMFQWAIEAARDSQFIDDIYISTHFDYAYNNILKVFPYLKRINRPNLLHGEVELLEVMQHAAKKHDFIDTSEFNFIQIQVNKPLTTTRDLDSYLFAFNSGLYDSLFQIQNIKQAVNGEYLKSRRHACNYKSCSIAKIWRGETLLKAKKGTFGQGKKHFDYLVGDHHIEIDNYKDFQIAKALKEAGF